MKSYSADSVTKEDLDRAINSVLQANRSGSNHAVDVAMKVEREGDKKLKNVAILACVLAALNLIVTVTLHLL